MPEPILITLIELAVSKRQKLNHKLRKWNIEDLLGEIYNGAKSVSREKQVINFAVANRLMMTEELTEG